ncbi:hypothetical protein MKX78_24175 [Cytobacillus sp. FSL R5-0569]|uniref:hypothetical protein n=1 Tax=Cytobacillus TaxID=2675230 RepID=UPI0027852AAF|nr:hypothetical protein [Cytobacillus kochii]MDQ0186668.1 hypothetical protein [Cytobacillus kochii]
MLWILGAIFVAVVGLGGFKEVIFGNEAQQVKSKLITVFGSILVVAIILLFIGVRQLNSIDSANVEENIYQEENNQLTTTTTSPKTPSNNERKEAILKGQDVTFNDDFYMAISEQSFDELMNNVAQNNTDATQRMVDKGDLILINKGTEAYVLNRTIGGLAEVEIINTGLRGFVVVEVLEKKK